MKLNIVVSYIGKTRKNIYEQQAGLKLPSVNRKTDSAVLQDRDDPMYWRIQMANGTCLSWIEITTLFLG
jgi:hypothetical protein